MTLLVAVLAVILSWSSRPLAPSIHRLGAAMAAEVEAPATAEGAVAALEAQAEVELVQAGRVVLEQVLRASTGSSASRRTPA